MKPFPDKAPAEIIVLGFDFTKPLLGLSVGETLSATATDHTWTAEDAHGVSAAAILNGSPTVSGNIVKQVVVGGNIGDLFTHECTSKTSAGRVLVLSNQQRIVKGGTSA